MYFLCIQLLPCRLGLSLGPFLYSTLYSQWCGAQCLEPRTHSPLHWPGTQSFNAPTPTGLMAKTLRCVDALSLMDVVLGCCMRVHVVQQCQYLFIHVGCLGCLMGCLKGLRPLIVCCCSLGAGLLLAC